MYSTNCAVAKIITEVLIFVSILSGIGKSSWYWFTQCNMLQYAVICFIFVVK